ncbi:MAG: hypothetical protein ACJA0Q_000525 [Saprospiraceae bacterium]|jgi:hypothetical protein
MDQKIDLSYIIPPIDVAIIKKELADGRFVRKSNKANNEIYIVNHHNSPNVMKEIGRLREVTFASAGGGTGQSIDIDENDTSENCYEQLIVWAPDSEVIIGGYRFIDCSKVIHTDPMELSTAHYFNFSDQFKSEYMPVTIELGRSWVQPDFQPSAESRVGLFSLDNLWDGLGAIVVANPQIKHFFGKVTMYTSYNTEARDAILYFMEAFFPDKDKLVTAIHPLGLTTDTSQIEALIAGKQFKEAIKELSQFCRARGENIPPLINNYMQLSSTMKSFGTASNPDFGGVEETGILVTIDDIFEAKTERHLDFNIR